MFATKTFDVRFKSNVGDAITNDQSSSSLRVISLDVRDIHNPVIDLFFCTAFCVYGVTTTQLSTITGAE